MRKKTLIKATSAVGLKAQQKIREMKKAIVGLISPTDDTSG
jgi:hypothetical protein